MRKSKCNRGNGIYARLSRIEMKCDRILAELFIIRASSRDADIDNAIERLHQSARMMRAMCASDRDSLLSKLKGSK